MHKHIIHYESTLTLYHRHDRNCMPAPFQFLADDMALRPIRRQNRHVFLFHRKFVHQYLRQMNLKKQNE